MTLIVLTGACSSGESPNSDSRDVGAILQNPIQTTPESLASGKKLYGRFCAECHGAAGDGVSEIASAMTEDEVRPPDLTDDKWDHGSTDGDIFVGIRDGVGVSGAMKGLNGRPGVGPMEMWHMVNYVRSLKK